MRTLKSLYQAATGAGQNNDDAENWVVRDRVVCNYSNDYYGDQACVVRQSKIYIPQT